MNIESFLATCPNLIWICIFVPSLFTLAGVFLARKWIKPHKRNSHHDIAHAILGPIATVFSILGAFMIATTWHEYSDTKSNLNEESHCLRTLYFNAESFSPEMCTKVQNLCRDYRKSVIENEWTIIVKGKDDAISDRIIGKLASLYRDYSLKTEKEYFYFGMSLKHLSKLRKYREQRIEDSSSGLLPLLWLLFLIGGISVVFVSLLMISSPSNTHGVIVILLSIMIGIMIFVIISLDFPFIGLTKISTLPLTSIPMDRNTSGVLEEE